MVYWILLGFIGIIGSLTGVSSITVVLNQRASLPCCSGEKVVWRKTVPIEATVAECLKQKCIVKDPFQERFAVKSEKNHSLFLNPAKYNDLGQYECSCDGFIKLIKLDVVVPMNMTVEELGNVTLPCYADTQSGVRDVTWLHNEQNALHYTTDRGSIPGLGYEERVSLTEDGFRDGDVSLTITGVHQTDAGLYRCFVQDETDRGYPHAYMLHVIKKLTGAGEDQNEGTCEEKLTCIGLIFSFLLFICFLLLLLFRCKKAASLTLESPESKSVQKSVQKQSTHPFLLKKTLV
ncbi:uncharacterized protein LOC127958814 isoform X7 [Carassius gibelio]|uniref:uncharacterized protein LOC127958814 isoform X7 n=1 Tax=Carassius gibelio TaxID=101364 RepID=UPI0022795092|nr:uncharacterized protein LOC127958814 isoform X7 [Carassius gibelio]